MSDERNAVEPVADPGANQGFTKSPTGKFVAIVVGLGILGIVVGVAVALVFYFFGGEQTVETPNSQSRQGSAAQPSTGATETASPEPRTPAEIVANADVFTFRNIFEPLLEESTGSGSTVQASSDTGSETASAETSDSVTPMEAGVLYLTNILGYSAGPKGLFYYNDQRYELGPGEGIPGTPWEVLRISPSGVVTMLYGDVQVTLTVGQGIRK